MICDAASCSARAFGLTGVPINVTRYLLQRASWELALWMIRLEAVQQVSTFLTEVSPSLARYLSDRSLKGYQRDVSRA
jgi:hypothetical protein